METHIPESSSQAMTETQIPSPAQIVEANICTGNPVALLLLEQMAHPASMITQALTQDDASLTTNVNTATTTTKLTAETK